MLISDTAGLDCLWHTLSMSRDNPEDKVDSEESKVVQGKDDNPSTNSDEPKEIGGRGGLDPTRYGDWEKAGRCIDF